MKRRIKKLMERRFEIDGGDDIDIDMDGRVVAGRRKEESTEEVEDEMEVRATTRMTGM